MAIPRNIREAVFADAVSFPFLIQAAPRSVLHGQNAQIPVPSGPIPLRRRARTCEPRFCEEASDEAVSKGDTFHIQVVLKRKGARHTVPVLFLSGHL